MDLLFLEQRIKRSICETDGTVFRFVNVELKGNKTELQKGDGKKKKQLSLHWTFASQKTGFLENVLLP